MTWTVDPEYPKACCTPGSKFEGKPLLMGQRRTSDKWHTALPSLAAFGYLWETFRQYYGQSNDAFVQSLVTIVMTGCNNLVQTNLFT